MNAPNQKLRLVGASILILSLLPACNSRREGEGSKSISKTETRSSSPILAEFAMAHVPGPDETAISRSQDHVRSHPRNSKAYHALAEALLVRKRETSNRKYFALAKDALVAAQKLDPTDALIRTTAVQLLFEDHQFEKAATQSRALIRQDSSNATAHLLLSDALLEQGDYDGAVASLENAMNRAPGLRVYARGSYLRWLDGDLEGAIEFMDDALRLGSLTPEAVAWCQAELGMLHWHAGNSEEASKAAARAIALVSHYPPALELMARIASSDGKRLEAIALYQDLLRRRRTVAAHLALSELLAAQGLDDEAKKQAELASSMASHDPAPLALYYARLDINSERALELASTAVAERSNVYTRDAQALALLRVGKAQAAKAALGEMSQGSLDSSLWLHRGLIMAATKDFDAARSSLATALATNAKADSLLVSELQEQLRRQEYSL